jgi:hypothetical protein
VLNRDRAAAVYGLMPFSLILFHALCRFHLGPT